jgi:hypothetical protein
MKTSLKTRIAAALAISLLAVSAAGTAAARPDLSDVQSGFGSSPGAVNVVRPDDRGGVRGIATSSKSASAASHYSKQALAAMGARYQAMAEYYGRPASSYYSAGALAAMGQRYQAQADALAAASAAAKAGPPRPDDRGGVLGPGPEPVVVTVHSTGFDWRDATIGFITASGCALLIGAAGAAALSRRRHTAATAA